MTTNSALAQVKEKLRTNALTGDGLEPELLIAIDALEFYRCKEHAVPHNGSEIMNCEACYVGGRARAALARIAAELGSEKEGE